MKVLIGATLPWLVIGGALGFTMLKIVVAGTVWPFLAVLLVTLFLITKIGCSTH